MATIEVGETVRRYVGWLRALDTMRDDPDGAEGMFDAVSGSDEYDPLNLMTAGIIVQQWLIEQLSHLSGRAPSSIIEDLGTWAARNTT